MKIGIDGQFLAIDHYCGLKTYSENLIFNLAKIDKGNEYIIFSKKKVEIPKQKNFKLKMVKNFFPIFRGIAYEQIFLPIYLAKEKLDLVNFLSYTGPIFYTGKKLFTIHDLRIFSKIYPPWETSVKFMINDFYERLTVNYLAVKEKNFIFCSNFTRNDFNQRFKKSYKKEATIYEGLDSRLKKQHSIKNLPKKFFMAMGDFSPHKNLESVIQTYAMFNLKIKKEYSLVILLSENLQKNRLFCLIKKLGIEEESILFLRNVPVAQLSFLYRSAFCFIFPSLFEGFGLPILEAMACGCPVICSNITSSSLPEIADGAALLVNPTKPQEINRGILRLIENKTLYNKLKARGLKQTKKFIWEKTARQTLNFYKKIYSGKI